MDDNTGLYEVMDEFTPTYLNTYGSVAEFCDTGSKLGGTKKRSILDHMRYYKSSLVCAMSKKYCMFLHLARFYFQRCHTQCGFSCLFLTMGRDFI